MSLGDTLERIHQEQKWEAYAETWGHLYPKPGDHPGTMVVAHSDYSDQGVTVVHERFEDVENSPWFYAAMTEFAFRSMYPTYRAPHMRTTIDKSRKKRAGIWEFAGVLRVHQNGKFRFIGKWTKMSLYPGRIPATKPRRHFGYIGTMLAHKDMLESDQDFLLNNRFGAVRLLETMNKRRGKRV